MTPALARIGHGALKTVHGRPRLRRNVLDRWLSASLGIPALPTDALIPLRDASDVLLICSGYLSRVHLQTYVQELAFAHELAAAGRPFAIAEDGRQLFGKNVAWFLPGPFVQPRLWDYSRQARDFALQLEDQGNRLFCSAAETSFWENKGYMHRRLAEVGAPTPRSRILTSETRHELELDRVPVLVKEEHSASSEGIHYFDSPDMARAFVDSYPFRPQENLIVQDVVRGATRDLRLTVVGNRVVETASYWRIKSAEALASPTWTPTATRYNSRVHHGDVPATAQAAIDALARLDVRTAGMDLMWPDDDVTGTPLILELSPYYQPNPPKPARYANRTYKAFKERPYLRDGYLMGQYRIFRKIAFYLFEQGLF